MCYHSLMAKTMTVKERKAAYDKDYREKNQERIRERQRAWYEKNKQKTIDRAVQWNRDNPEARKRAQRNYDIRKKYGLDPEDYEAMLAEQDGVCAICGTSPEGYELHVDHCHSTGAVRGLLCRPCNQGLGMMEDDCGRLRAAISYLERTTPHE